MTMRWLVRGMKGEEFVTTQGRLPCAFSLLSSSSNNGPSGQGTNTKLVFRTLQGKMLSVGVTAISSGPQVNACGINILKRRGSDHDKHYCVALSETCVVRTYQCQTALLY